MIAIFYFFIDIVGVNIENRLTSINLTLKTG